MRLAYFNTQAIARPDLKMDHFTGVPIPFICYVLPFLVLLMCFVPFSVMRVILPIAYLLIAVGYILKVRIAKMSLRTGLIMVAVEAACCPRPVPCGQRHHRLSAFRRYPPYHLVERRRQSGFDVSRFFASKFYRRLTFDACTFGTEALK